MDGWGAAYAAGMVTGGKDVDFLRIGDQMVRCFLAAIVICIVIGAAIGVGIGWLIWG